MTRTAALLALAALPLAGAAQTATVYESFSYPIGSPPTIWNGGTGWAATTPTWVIQGGNYGIQPGSPSYVTPGGAALQTAGNFMDTLVFPPAPTGNRLRRSFAADLAATNGGTWWMSLIVRRTGVPVANDYGGITLGNGGGSTADVGRLYIGDAGGSNEWALERAGGGNAASSGLSSLTFAPTLLVVQMEINNAGYDTARLYVNPTTLGGAAPPVPSAVLSTVDFNPGGIAVSEVNLDFGNATFHFDELRVGTTYASVTPTPEPGAVLGVAALAAAALHRRRRLTACAPAPSAGPG